MDLTLQLNARLRPNDRGDLYENRLDEYLKKEGFGGKYFLKPLHGNEREWDDRVCIVVPGINPGV